MERSYQKSSIKLASLRTIFPSTCSIVTRIQTFTIDLTSSTRNIIHLDRGTSFFPPTIFWIYSSVLRELYIKTDNHINGRYFAQIAKQVAEDLEDAKYQHAEPRLSIYGREYDEFSKLAKWAVSNDVFSNHIVWLIQVPRLYDIYKKKNPKLVFQTILKNIFGPVMDASLKPQENG